MRERDRPPEIDTNLVEHQRPGREPPAKMDNELA
jgi:hypothetical protein